MLREQISIAKQVMLLFDLFLVTIAFFLSYQIRNTIHDIYALKDYLIFLPIILSIWSMFLLNYFGAYCSFRVDKMPVILFSILKMAFLGLLLFGSVIYLFKTTHISRGFILMIFALSALFIGIEKICLIYLLKMIRRKGFNSRNILIVGTGKKTHQFIERIESNLGWGYKIIGLIKEDPNFPSLPQNGVPILGSLEDIPEIIHHNVVDEVIFIVPRSCLYKIEKSLLFCENEGIHVNVAVDFFELKLSHAKQTDMDGFPLISFKPTPDKLWPLMAKRLFDIVSSFSALLILAPVFGGIALLIKMVSPGSIFFKQARCGLHGRHFSLYKFRTMVVGAESKLKDLMAQNEMKGPVFKMENDPRITSWGKTLRKFSLDELPQLWNVLRGDMSLVGPRPPIPSEVNLYDPWHRRRLSVRPGITCLWQVNGRNKIIDFNEWVKLDLEYIDQWSLWLEFKILLKTIPVVLSGSGAK